MVRDRRKAAAEASKRYRERQKVKGPEFSRKHAERQKATYIPRHLLPKSKLLNARQKGVEKTRRYRERKKLIAEKEKMTAQHAEAKTQPHDTRRSARLSTETLSKGNRLIVAMPFPSMHSKSVTPYSPTELTGQKPPGRKRQHPKVYRDLQYSREKIRKLETRLATERQRRHRSEKKLDCRLTLKGRTCSAKNTETAAICDVNDGRQSDAENGAPSDTRISDTENVILSESPSVSENAKVPEHDSVPVVDGPNTIVTTVEVHSVDTDLQTDTPSIHSDCSVSAALPTEQAARIRVGRCFLANDDPFILSEPATPGSMVESPGTRAANLIRSEGISPRDIPSVAKRLKFTEAVLTDLKKSDRKTKRKLLYGNNIRCGRFKKTLSQELRLARCQRARSCLNNRLCRPTRRAQIAEARRKLVVDFLLRPDNSTVLPGKRDNKKMGVVKVQKHVLHDSMEVLHTKFLIEEPDCKVGLSTFCRYRPAYILLVKYRDRKVCLCAKHQNIDLKLKTMEKYESYPATPDLLITMSNEEILTRARESLPARVAYQEWQKTGVMEGGREISRVQIVSCEREKDEFISLLGDSLDAFREHVRRYQVQYKEAKHVKDNLSPEEATIQIDFAENYTAGHFHEVQSAYYSKPSITLHPAVVHYVDQQTNTQQVKSYVITSDDHRHVAGTVFAFLQTLLPKVQHDLPLLKHIHYLSDSPSSQYRNRKMFTLLQKHKELFGLTADWLYFESGHGKGPCDGVGGSSKGNADLAVKRGRVISNSAQFCEWGNSIKNGKVTYMNVTPDQVSQGISSLNEMTCPRPVPGTLKLHTVVVPTPGKVLATRVTACFKGCCYTPPNDYPLTCEGWTTINMVQDPLPNASTAETPNQVLETNPSADNHQGQVTSKEPDQGQPAEGNATEGEHEGQGQVANAASGDQRDKDQVATYEIGEHVAAWYGGMWYIGEVLEYDPDDQEYRIPFLQNGPRKGSYTFREPSHPDITWRPDTLVLCGVSKPQESGRTRKVYTFAQKDIDNILNIAASREGYLNKEDAKTT